MRRALLAAAVLSLAAASSRAETNGFRCVIEPALVVRIGSPVVGLLRNVPVGRGDMVKAGQLVAELDSQVEEATLDLVRLRASSGAAVGVADARLGLDQKQLERAEQLVERQAASAELLDERRAALEVARQNLLQAELEQKVLELEIARTEALVDQRRVTSPIDGVVSERRLSAGEYVHQEAFILEVAQLDPLHVEVFLPLELYGEIVPGMKAEVRPQEPIGGVHEAAVTVVDKVMDAASGTFGVRLELPNEDLALPAGVRCDVVFTGVSGPQERS